MKLYEYAVVLHPKKKKESDPLLASRLILSPQSVMAESIDHARMYAARDIPTEYAERLDEVEILIRPFVSSH